MTGENVQNYFGVFSKVCILNYYQSMDDFLALMCFNFPSRISVLQSEF